VVFNQQIFTGLSLQPYHYEFYIANYLTILAGVLTIWILLGQAIRLKRILFVGLFALSWGFGELMYSANIHHKKNVQRDELMAATTTIQEPGLVYSRDIAVVNNNISTFSPLSVLWGLHTQVCVGLTPDEGRNRFYHFSYFAGYTPDMLKRSLLEKDYYTTAALFGYERAGGSRLLESRKLIQNDEIDQAVSRYADYIRAFDFAKATQPEIRYVITTPNAPEYPSRLDQWYERVEAKQFGGFTVYRIEPRAISGERGGESHPGD
jgi:hypothetical protein